MRTQLLKRTVALGAATALAFAGLVASDGGASAAGPNNLTVKQLVTDGASSGHTKLLIDVKNVGDAASTVFVTGFLTTTSGGAGISASGTGWSCALQGKPAGWKYMYTCSQATIAANSTNRLTLDMSGTAGAGFTNFVSVGEKLPGESSIADNTSTISSYFGPRANLVVSQTASVTAATVGHVIVTTKTTNKGPWTAHNLQLVVEVKASGSLSAVATSTTPSAACQVIPPASGFNFAFACTMSGTLAPGAAWTIKINHKGPAGGATQIVSKTTAISPADPLPANNKVTTNTHYKSRA